MDTQDDHNSKDVPHHRQTIPVGIFLAFFPQAPVCSPMCPTSSINLVQWPLRLCWAPRLPALASHTTGQFEGFPPLGDQRHKQEREGERSGTPNSKKKQFPNTRIQELYCNAAHGTCRPLSILIWSFRDESAHGIITQKLMLARSH